MAPKNGFSVAVISREMSAWKLPSQPHSNELANRPRNESKLTDAICENRIQIEAFWFHYIGHEKPVGSLIDLLSISITNNAADLGIFGCAHVRRRCFSSLLSFCVNQTEKFRFLKCLWMKIAARHNSNASSAIDKLLFSSLLRSYVNSRLWMILIIKSNSIPARSEESVWPAAIFNQRQNQKTSS